MRERTLTQNLKCKGKTSLGQAEFWAKLGGLSEIWIIMASFQCRLFLHFSLFLAVFSKWPHILKKNS